MTILPAEPSIPNRLNLSFCFFLDQFKCVFICAVIKMKQSEQCKSQTRAKKIIKQVKFYWNEGAFTDTRQTAIRLPLQTIGLLVCDYDDIKFASLRQAS